MYNNHYNKLIYLVATCLALLLTGSSSAKKEKLLIGGSRWGQIAIIDKSTEKIEWSYALNPGEECNHIALTARNEVLFTYNQGARLITREGEVLWDYKVGNSEKTHTAIRMKSGNYMIAVCGTPSRIVELNAKGDLVNEISINTESANYRQILKTTAGTYLFPYMDKAKVSEVDKNGKVLRSVECGGTPFSVKLIDKRNWLVYCGDSHAFVEIDPKKQQVIKRVETTDLKWSGSLLFVAELIRYKNGNTLIANWNGHSNDKSQPLLVEINTDNQVVWQLAPNPEITNISTVYSFFE
jgi:hypothetical protein